MITFNDVAPPQQPYDVNENPATIKTDTSSILGNISRMQAPSRKRAVLRFMATPATFQFFQDLFDAATEVTYKNTHSNVSGGTLEFVGVIDYNEESYVRGGSKLVPLTVTILDADVTGI